MVRDFTDEAKEKLLSQISDIESHDWSWFTDWLGDMSFHIQKWAGLLRLEENMSNVEAYHKAILDMNNVKSNELEYIFESIYGEETKVANQFAVLNEKLQSLRDNMQRMAGQIDSGFVSADAASIQKIGKELQADLKNVNSTLTELQNQEQTKLLTLLLQEQAKEMVKDCLSVAAEIALLPISKGTLGMLAGLHSGSWDILNHSFAAIESVTATVFAIIGLGAGKIGCEEARYSAYQTAKELAELDGLTDHFEKESEKDPNNKLYKTLSSLSEVVDTVNGGYKVLDTGMGVADKFLNAGEVKSVDTTKKILGFEFGEKQGIKWEDYKKLYGGYQSDWEKFNEVYSQMENEANRISNIQSAYKLAEGFCEDLFGNSNEKNGVKAAIDQTAAGKVIDGIAKGIEFKEELPDKIDEIKEFFKERPGMIYFCGLE